jgi:2-oxoglutarate/2-oxoacid ferredoxin oxidoreductase subunit beta
MTIVYKKSALLADKPLHYCPGCTHGIVHKLIAETIEEMGLGDRAIGIAPVGCAAFAPHYFNFDMYSAAHGRALAVATGIKRTQPEALVFTYQGDGDLAAIGTAETVHAANRGEAVTAIFINNAIYGMTGGQMAPTTLLGQKTTTSPYGRDAKREGFPLHITEMLAGCEGAVYIERTAACDVAGIIKTKRAIKKAFEIQMTGKGFTMVEVLSTCSTNWGMSPVEAMQWIKDAMMPVYPVGVIKEAL